LFCLALTTVASRLALFAADLAAAPGLTHAISPFMLLEPKQPK
jgi:hypothetical protein